jgi:zinc transporter ZupT
MGSELAEPIRKYGAFLGLIIAFATIFNFLLPDILEILDGNTVFGVVFASMISFAVLGRIIEFLKRILLSTKKKANSRPTMPKIIAIDAIELIVGLIYGAAVGVSFSVTTGSGIMLLCAFILFCLVSRVQTIRRYQLARMTRRANIIALIIPSCIAPAATIITYLLARTHYRSMGFFMSVALGFLVYISLFNITTLVVKKFKNR